MMTTATPGTISGATQTPLVDPAQLVPGVYLTGEVHTAVWEVLGVPETREGQEGLVVLLQKLQSGLPIHPEERQHAWVSQGRSRQCACGLRWQSVRGGGTAATAGLLPHTDGIPTTHLIIPSETVQPVRPYTLYLTSAGMIVTRDTWPRDLPVVPRLTVFWTVPPELIRLVEG